MKITNDDCITMYTGLTAVEQPKFEDIKNLEDRESYLFHAEFVLAVSYNKRMLKPIAEALQDSTENKKEYKKYLESRDKLLQKYAVKDEKGAPMERVEILPGNRQRRSYIVPELADENSAASRAVNKLEKDNDEHIKAREKQNDEFKEGLKKETEVDIKMIRWSQVPNGLQPFMMDGVILMIDMESIPKDDSKPEKPDKK